MSIKIKTFVLLLILIGSAGTKVCLSNDITEGYVLDNKCASFISPDKMESLRKKMSNVLLNDDNRPILQKSYSSLSGYFLIHYDISGINSVDIEDLNNNSVPDYIDSVAYYFDFAYRTYIDTIGYIVPFADNEHGGTNQYDIYLMEIGIGKNAYYGWTTDDFEILPRKNFYRAATYITLDNNYSPFDSMLVDLTGTIKKVQTYKTSGIEAMKITACHEFHHAIQWSYGDYLSPNHSSIYEMTSTWMEYRLYPEVKDYHQFVRNLFRQLEKYPFGYGYAFNGYGWSIFGHYLYKEYADSILLRVWEMVGEGISPYQALNDAIVERGSSLSEAWCEFLPWMFYTGSKSKEGMYFDDAADFPEIKFYRNEVFKSPRTIFDGKLKAFEVRGYRCILPPQQNSSVDTLDIILGNTDLSGAVLQLASNYTFTIKITEEHESDCEQIEGSKYYYGVDFPNGGYCYNPYFLISNSIDIAYPNPFRPDLHKTLNFPAPLKAGLNEKIYLTIYSAEMLERYGAMKMVTVNQVFRNDEQRDRVVQVSRNDLDNLSSGVYIYSLDYKGEIFLGKFVIRK